VALGTQDGGVTAYAALGSGLSTRQLTHITWMTFGRTIYARLAVWRGRRFGRKTVPLVAPALLLAPALARRVPISCLLMPGSPPPLPFSSRGFPSAVT